MELVPTLKLGPRSISIIGHNIEANRAGNRASITFFTSISTTFTSFIVDHRNVVVPKPHKSNKFKQTNKHDESFKTLEIHKRKRHRFQKLWWLKNDVVWEICEIIGQEVRMVRDFDLDQKKKNLSLCLCVCLCFFF